MADEVQAAAIPAASKQTALWCIGRLPPLYVNYRMTNESRYGDEITRLVQAVLKELIQGKRACPKAAQLAASIPDRFRLFHEQWGIPRLALKPNRASTPRSQKVS